MTNHIFVEWIATANPKAIPSLALHELTHYFYDTATAAKHVSLMQQFAQAEIPYRRRAGKGFSHLRNRCFAKLNSQQNQPSTFLSEHTVSIKPESFAKRLKAYFERYSTTTQVLEALLKQQAAPQDFIVLACARLDSLANHALPGKLSQSEKFARFLNEHSGHKDVLSGVSAGDLYFSLLVELWQLPGVVELPGRLRVFDEIRQRDFIELYWKSGLALDEPDLEGLLDFLITEVQGRFRVIPHQSRAKSYSESLTNLQRFLQDASTKIVAGRYKPAMEALKPILRSHQLASILYRDYRNGSIHGAGVDVDEDGFFAADVPYWSPVEYVFASVKPVFQVTFPAKFLLSVYRNCVEGYQKKLLATKKLPSSIFDQMFPGTITRHLEYLDQTSVQEAIELRPK